jgi:hypothetical protein
MISVRNRRLPLSGNNRLAWVFALLIMAACSPKVRPTVKTVPNNPAATQTGKPSTVTKPVTPAKQVTKSNSETSAIALLLPFSLDKLNSARGYSKADLKKANLAIDYYQGFKLGLDSLTAEGYNYKLQVYDTKDEPGYTHSLSNNPAIRNSNLIVGPVFPEGIKSFTGRPVTIKKPILSPLSPLPPAFFNNPNLITVNPPLEYHAFHVAKYINSKMKARNVYILKSGFSEDNKYIVPFIKAMDSLSRKKVNVTTFTVVRGSLTALLPKLNNKVENVFIVPSVNQSFLLVTFRWLDTLAKHYPVTVFGHPNWEKFSFLKPDILQRLKTHITSAERVNYHTQNTINFIKAYRKNFNSEPTSYAYKGFDEAMYFGEVLAQEDNEITRLDRHDYKALHNDFHFEKKSGTGWVNTYVSLLKYANFELKQVE